MGSKNKSPSQKKKKKNLADHPAGKRIFSNTHKALGGTKNIVSCNPTNPWPKPQTQKIS